MNTQLPGPVHVRRRTGSPSTGRTLVALAVAGLLALTGFSNAALADEPESGALQSGQLQSDSTANSSAQSGGVPEPDDQSADRSATPGGNDTDAGSVTDPEGVENPVELQAAQAGVRAAAKPIVCQAGYVYSVSEDGQLREITAGGVVTDVGNKASNVDSFNGLGIGSSGQLVYAYERTNSDQTVTMHKYDPASGNWKKTGDTYDTTKTNQGGFKGSLVAGAVDLKDGTYMFGGFQTDTTYVGIWPWGYTVYAQVFKLWRYDPSASSKFSYLGSINTYQGSTALGNANGDMAFDAAGNLFIVRGSGSTTTVFSVTASDLATAAGGVIPSSGSSEYTTTSNVNGVAFDAAGKAYLGAGSTIQSFNMPNWSNKTTVVSNNSAFSDSTDLASCSSPATITLQKVVNGRVAPSDQFTLALKDGGTELGTATTTGTSTGVQQDRVGPQPTVRGKTITFTETAAEDTDLGHYATTYECTVDGNPLSPAVSGAGTTGSVTIPTSGQSVLCQFTNSPLIAHVNVTKTILDVNGTNAQPGEGWTVGSKSTATKGAATQSPSATQQTDATGSASWTVAFDKVDSAAEVEVSETQKTGYEFASGKCTVTNSAGTAGEPIEISSASGVKVPNVGPGDTLDCSFTNQKQATSLKLTKIVDNRYGGIAGPNDFKLTATPSEGQALDFSSGETKDVNPGTWTIGETLLPGYQQRSLVCEADQEEIPVSGSTVTVADGQSVECTLTNTDKAGSVVWEKVSENDEPLAGSVWTLTGLDGTGSTSVKVEDCVADQAGDCTGFDKDRAGGSFLVEGLKWGDYTLVETKAPAGYQRLDTEYRFTIDGTHLQAVVNNGDAIVNKQQVPPSLPLTGGLGTDTFLLAGGGLLALAGVGGFIHRRRSLRLRNV